MGTLIFALIFIFIIWPAIKFFWHLYTVQRQARQMFAQMNSTRQQTTGQEQRKAGWSKPAVNKRKKIDRDTGEYVSYENISAGASSFTSSSSETEYTEVRTESQISDAEWEDIK